MSPTSSATKTLMTADEFFDFVHQPQNADRWFELVRGEVIELSSPTKPHGVVCMNVGFELTMFVRARKFGYVTSNDSGVILTHDPDTVRGPDVALYEDAAAWEELHPKYGEVPPILAVEVLSPNDRANRVLDKINDYLRTGVKLVWVIDPELRSVTVFAPGREPLAVTRDGELTGGDALPGLAVRVGDLFSVAGQS